MRAGPRVATPPLPPRKMAAVSTRWTMQRRRRCDSRQPRQRGDSRRSDSITTTGDIQGVQGDQEGDDHRDNNVPDNDNDNTAARRWAMATTTLTTIQKASPAALN
ncbi:hypothetical protein EDB89DRAFT_1904090 [Lactarius sanguifluus]|nr:hypothetical protein EDB89DRAFT_1904090 [Lactarius sanguifluus]